MAKLEKVVEPAKAVKAVLAVKNPLLDRIEELEGDLYRLVQLLGKQFGGKFAEEALEIVIKKQGK